MAKNKFSMALLGASAAFVLVSGVTQAQNISNQNAATGTESLQSITITAILAAISSPLD